MSRIHHSSKSAQKGVVLIEAMVSILLFALGVLAVAGLQASMIKNSADAKFRAEASSIAQQMIGQMWSDPTGTYASVYNKVTSISNLLPNGTMQVTQPVPNGPYEIVVSWQQPGQDPHNFTTNAMITTNSRITTYPLTYN